MCPVRTTIKLGTPRLHPTHLHQGSSHSIKSWKASTSYLTNLSIQTLVLDCLLQQYVKHVLDLCATIWCRLLILPAGLPDDTAAAYVTQMPESLLPSCKAVYMSAW